MEAGFALVEALASLVVVAMISLLMIAGVGAGRRTWERMGRREAAGDQIDSAQTLLRDRIEQAFPATLYPATPYDAAAAADFTGGPGRLVFLAEPPQSRRPSILIRYDLSLDGAGALRLTATPDAGPGAAETSALVAGVRGLDIAYHGEGPDGRGQWFGQWRGRPAPPDLVRIRLSFAAGDRRVWRDLIVHPRATVDAACLLNLVTHACKGRS